MAYGAQATHSLEEGPSPEEPREPSDPWHIGTLWLSLDQLCQQAALPSSCGGMCPQHILWIHDLGFSHQEGERPLASHSPEFHFHGPAQGRRLLQTSALQPMGNVIRRVGSRRRRPWCHRKPPGAVCRGPGGCREPIPFTFRDAAFCLQGVMTSRQGVRQ